MAHHTTINTSTTTTTTTSTSTRQEEHKTGKQREELPLAAAAHSVSQAQRFFKVSSGKNNPAFPYISPYAQGQKPAQRQTATSKGFSLISPWSSSSHQQRCPGSHSPESTSSKAVEAASDNMSSSRNISVIEKAQLIRSLQTHKVNTLTELRRIEKIFEGASSAETAEPMTNAWAHYVNSNQLLSELRALTKNYPFSSECLDEAKWRVVEDSANNRSRNYCWLVLSKIRKDGLIAKHARTLATKPAMWGGRTPTAAGVEKLASACVAEWTRALDQMLRNWTSPPVRQ